MARKKSVQDIMRQLNRIETSPNITMRRLNRAWNASDRYIDNIRAKRGQHNARARSYNAWAGGDHVTSNIISMEQNAKRYSRNTYMGLNKG